MLKEYLRVEAQIELLERRGMTCGPQAARILMREGYYAVINGYGKPFLSLRATQAAGEDRYAPGTEFSHVYALFSFDRALRMLTFGQLTRIEGMLRAVMAASFLEAHDGPEDYLNEVSYSTARHYLLGEREYERNLRHTISTLSRYAHDHEQDERGRDDARLAHYRNHYDHVPLWVVFSDFSYGNLYHFLALMKRREQEAVCARLSQVLAGDDTPTCETTAPPQLTRQALVRDVGLQVEVRNICAHGERLYDARIGERDALGYANFVRMIARFLPNEELAIFDQQLVSLMNKLAGTGPVLNRILAQTRIREVLSQRPHET